MIKNTIALVSLSLCFFGSVAAQETPVVTENPALKEANQSTSRLVALRTPQTKTAENSSEFGTTAPAAAEKDNMVPDPEIGNGFEARQTGPSSDRNKFELFAGYSADAYINSEFESIGHGFNVSGVYYFHRYVGTKVDVSGTYKSVRSDLTSFDHSLYNLTGGVQIKDSSRETVWKPFGHALVGIGRHQDQPLGLTANGYPTVNFDGFSTVVGVGLDVKVHRNIDIRLIQVDFNPITFRNDDGVTNIYVNFRYSAGIVFNF